MNDELDSERWQQLECPQLITGHYKVTSYENRRYNCFAWAAGDVSRIWEPNKVVKRYWPEGAPKEYILQAYIEAFQLLGYELCGNNSQFEVGFVKVAIYVDEHNFPLHMARQLYDGTWTSKLGRWEDIRHLTLESLEGPGYGRVVNIMKRPRQGSDPEPPSSFIM